MDAKALWPRLVLAMVLIADPVGPAQTFQTEYCVIYYGSIDASVSQL